MNTEALYFASGGAGNWVVQIDGLGSLISYMGLLDEGADKSLIDALKDAGTPALSRARAYANTLSDDGTYAGSLRIVFRKANYEVGLQSTDQAARVKEFARIGAKTLTSKGTPLANARLAKKSGVGVPRKVPMTPRAMVPAVNAAFNDVWRNVNDTLDKLLRKEA